MAVAPSLLPRVASPSIERRRAASGPLRRQGGRDPGEPRPMGSRPAAGRVMVMGEAATRAASRRKSAAPDGYDQVVRREEFEEAHPAAHIRCDGRDWRAQWSLGGPPLRSRPHWQLNGLLDELDRLAAVDAERRAIMGDFPGWHCYVTRRGPMEWWRAFPLGDGVQAPPEVIAATPAGLRTVIAAAAWSRWRLIVPAWAAA